jgi:death-on-curing protein
MWAWVSDAIALAAHREQIAEHGGGDGVRDPGLFESAMARPKNLAAYGEPDAADVAASYAFGIARNHPFVDGNKRTAAVVSETFLILNGLRLDVGNPELVVQYLALAAGDVSEEEMAAWLRARIVAD